MFIKIIRNITVVCCLMLIVSAGGDANSATGDVWTKAFPGSDGTTFKVSVYVDTKEHKLGVYQFRISFNQDSAHVDTTQGMNGIEAGTDGFLAAVNTNNEIGRILVNGVDVKGKGPGANLEVLRIYFKSHKSHEYDDIRIEVEYLANEEGVSIIKG